MITSVFFFVAALKSYDGLISSIVDWFQLIVPLLRLAIATSPRLLVVEDMNAE